MSYRLNKGSSKNDIRDFQNSPTFERSECIYVETTGNSKRFQFLKLETSFRKTFFKKLEDRFAVQSTKIENVTFLYKTDMPEEKF